MSGIASSDWLVRALLLATMLLALPTAGGTVAAQEQPQTAEEYFNTLRSMESMEIYGTYGELETIHARSLTAVQVGEFDDAERRKLDAVIGLLRSFSNATDHVENGNYRAAFRAAERVRGYIQTLEKHDKTYGVLARLALTRFYENLGNQLSSRANAVERTPAEIELLSMAATAYKRANEPTQAAEFVRQSQRLRAQFQADVAFMNQTATQTRTFFQQCEQCRSPIGAIRAEGLDVFGLYEEARAHYWNAIEARQRARTHGLSDRAATFGDLAARAGAVWGALAAASAALVIGYGIVVGLLAAFVTWRVFSWERTYLAARVDSIVAMGDGDV